MKKKKQTALFNKSVHGLPEKIELLNPRFPIFHQFLLLKSRGKDGLYNAPESVRARWTLHHPDMKSQYKHTACESPEISLTACQNE